MAPHHASVLTTRDPVVARDVGEALAGRLHAAESAIDTAMREAATLISLLPAARADLWLSAVTGQQVFETAAASVQALAEARGHMVSTHNALAALARRLGLDILATGPVDKPEDTPPIGGGPNGARPSPPRPARRLEAAKSSATLA